MLARELAEREGGICLEDAEAGTLLFDRFGRSAMRMPVGGSAEDEVGFFFERSKTIQHSPWRHLLIHLTEDALDDDASRDAAGRLAEAAASAGFAELRLHLLSSDRDWPGLLDWFAALRNERVPQAQRGMLTIDCPFAPLDDDVMETLFRLGVHCRYVGGWFPGCEERAKVRITEKGIDSLATFGFYVPVVWYVHAENVQVLRDALQRGLVRNYNAGFSLPLISASPYFDFDESRPALPSAVDYAALLAHAYSTYPHYDLAFSPVRELAELAATGGWDTNRAVPTRSQIIIRPDAGLMAFRHVPAFGVKWCEATRLKSLDPIEIQNGLVEFERSNFDLSVNRFCHHCQWKYVCGGMDCPPTDEAAPAAEEWFDTHCYHRMMFLEMFMRLRFHGPAT